MGCFPGGIYLPTVSPEGLWGASRGDIPANCLPRGVMGCFPGGIWSPTVSLEGCSQLVSPSKPPTIPPVPPHNTSSWCSSPGPGFEQPASWPREPKKYRPVTGNTSRYTPPHSPSRRELVRFFGQTRSHLTLPRSDQPQTPPQHTRMQPNQCLCDVNARA